MEDWVHRAIAEQMLVIADKSEEMAAKLLKEAVAQDVRGTSRDRLNSSTRAEKLLEKASRLELAVVSARKQAYKWLNGKK